MKNRGAAPRSYLFNVRMIGDVVGTIAVVATAAGAVAELQLRVGHIGPAAYGAAMGVGRFRSRHGSFVGAGRGERNCAGFLCGLVPEQATEIGFPGHGDDIAHILAEEQEVVHQRHQREQAEGEKPRQGEFQHTEKGDRQVDQGKDPGFDRNDEHEQKMRIGIKGCIGQKQAHVQITCTGSTAENQAEDIHHQHAAEIEQIEAEGSPKVLDGAAERIIAKKDNSGQQNIAGIIHQRIGEKAPYLTLQNRVPIEAQQIIKRAVTAYAAEKIYNCSTQRNIQHQIGNALVPMPITEALKVSTKILQNAQLLVLLVLFYQLPSEKSIGDL